jgi:hypothetical protein
VETNGHPDLVKLGRSLRDRMDRTLEAEMEAARSAARRSRSLRDVFLAAEDGEEDVRVTAADGMLHAGRVTAVGADHVELTRGELQRVVSLSHVVTVERAR